ncbi:efflux RND transporter permease subunit (plasmid) [Chroococcidiopsis sp. CCNUC1]|nr:efflux RND transporter permease subunit [Chroococcidiopsis sp. CCNUC1]URD53406.1 efflux RND transporter permease subunit [Chroococcidiopsis sp. CCNUC1]
MFVDLFIKRPVFAIVCAIVILLVGLISLTTLPVALFPNISPTQIVVRANYVGASATVVEETVTNVLEREINGVEGMRYMVSTSSNDGSSNITVTFRLGYNPDTALVNVLNRVSVAEPRLPDVVQQTGVSVSKQSSAAILGIAVYSQESDKYDENFISNYMDLYVLDTLERVEGVSNVARFGERRYAMRLWLNPTQMASRGLTTQDVVDALDEQNIQLGVGRIGQPPVPNEQLYQIDVQAQGRLKKATEFENLVLKTGADGTLVKLKDVGRAELGAEDYSSTASYSKRKAVGYQIFQLPDSNALSVANGVKAELARLAKNFPPGIVYEIPYDGTKFVEESRQEVVNTLWESIALVVLVIFVFLQDWRASLIAAIAIPVSLIGTFAFVKVFNFSLNSLTLFGIILGTGMVVDDAIVIVEDIARLMKEKGLSPLRAASEAMHELFGAVIATSLVLMAVFVPVAFFPGSTGQLYQQFALTIAFATGVSTFNAITLTPALSALLLSQQPRYPRSLGWIFTRLNRFLEWVRRRYQQMLHFLIRIKIVLVAAFVASLFLTAWLYLRTPQAFLPDEDQGYFINLIQGPDGTSLNYTSQVIEQAETILLQNPEVAGTFALGGFGFTGNTANQGLILTPLKPWGDRQQSYQSAQAAIAQVQKPLASILEATVLPVNPPAIQGLGSIGGFVFQLQDRSNNNEIDTLVQTMGKLLERANQTPELQRVFSTYTG